ncbi:hypothetical protein Tco_0747199 [Tanacetum coccineum]
MNEWGSWRGEGARGGGSNQSGKSSYKSAGQKKGGKTHGTLTGAIEAGASPKGGVRDVEGLRKWRSTRSTNEGDERTGVGEGWQGVGNCHQSCGALEDWAWYKTVIAGEYALVPGWTRGAEHGDFERTDGEGRVEIGIEKEKRETGEYVGAKRAGGIRSGRRGNELRVRYGRIGIGSTQRIKCSRKREEGGEEVAIPFSPLYFIRVLFYGVRDASGGGLKETAARSGTKKGRRTQDEGRE